MEIGTHLKTVKNTLNIFAVQYILAFCLDACPDNSLQRQCVLFTFVYFLSSQWGGVRHATTWARAIKNVKKLQNQMCVKTHRQKK